MTLIAMLLLAGALPFLFATACAPAEATPDQPIAFNHQLHAEAEIRCVRCHLGAETEDHAGLMLVDRCAACHRRQAQENEEAQKVVAAWEAKTPILWRRVDWIPERSGVQFSHAAHARAEVSCEVCHGDVAAMTVAQPPATHDLGDMDWCVDCHRSEEASIDCLTCHY